MIGGTSETGPFVVLGKPCHLLAHRIVLDPSQQTPWASAPGASASLFAPECRAFAHTRSRPLGPGPSPDGPPIGGCESSPPDAADWPAAEPEPPPIPPRRSSGSGSPPRKTAPGEPHRAASCNGGSPDAAHAQTNAGWTEPCFVPRPADGRCRSQSPIPSRRTARRPHRA